VSVFVDTCVFYALQNERAARHETARDALRAVARGRYGAQYTSDYVYDEVVTLVRTRTGSFAEARTAGRRILGRGPFPEVFSLLYVTPETFESAVETFERYDDQSLSFTDATIVALAEEHAVDTVLSFDRDFEGLVDRLDPAAAATDGADG
jgi:hypothetical protein